MLRLPAGADLAAGSFVLTVGLASMFVGRTYSWGEGALIGPAVFPFWIGVLASGFGLAILAEGFLNRQSREFAGKVWNIRGLAAILASIGSFAFLVERFGLVPAVVAAVVVASLAEPRPRPLAIMILAVSLAGAAVVIFIWGLNLPFRPFRW